VDRYVGGGDCEEEFNRIRHEVFATGERERLTSSRQQGLQRQRENEEGRLA
jgi:hypothetical protein